MSSPAAFLPDEVALKFRGWLLLLIFAHVMLHPWVHALDAGKVAADRTSISNASSNLHITFTASDQCELCRVGHSAALSLKLPQADLLNPHWIHTALQAVNYASLQADLRRPSRAPPVL